MSCSSPDWEVVIQDSDGYDEAVEQAKRLRFQIDHENGHSEEDLVELEAHLATVEAGIACWEQEQREKQEEREKQLQEAEE